MGIMKIVVPIHKWVGRVKWILTTVPGSEYKFKKHELYQLSQFGELVDSQTSRPQLWTPSWKILTHTSTQMLMLFLGFTELPCHHLPGLEPPCRKQLATDKESVFSYANQVPHCQDAFSLYVNRQLQRELLMGLEMGKERTGSFKLVIHCQFPSGKQRDWVPRSIQPGGELGLWSRDLTKSASPPQFFSVPYRDLLNHFCRRHIKRQTACFIRLAKPSWENQQAGRSPSESPGPDGGSRGYQDDWAQFLTLTRKGSQVVSCQRAGQEDPANSVHLLMSEQTPRGLRTCGLGLSLEEGCGCHSVLSKFPGHEFMGPIAVKNRPAS